MIKTLVFELDKSQVLNSNNKLHMFLHSKAVSYLRKLAAEEGMKIHEEDNRVIAQEKMDLLYSEADLIAKRKKLRKTLVKKKGLTAEDIETQIDSKYPNDETAKLSKDVPVKPLFGVAKVTIIAAPPTRRRMDPPNLWPTAKAILDGLTDASWWADDDFKHVVETSFRYGGISGEKDTFKITVVIEEVTEIDSYILESEVVEIAK
jgi:Holliday junction resolvase RusA-like endonuclease